MPGDDRSDDEIRELEEGISSAFLKLYDFYNANTWIVNSFQTTFYVIMSSPKKKKEELVWSFVLMKTIVMWLFKPSFRMILKLWSHKGMS